MNEFAAGSAAVTHGSAQSGSAGRVNRVVK